MEVIQAAALGFAEGGVKREKRVAVLVVGRESGKSTERLHWGLLSCWLLFCSGFLGPHALHADLFAWLLWATMMDNTISGMNINTRLSVIG